MLKLNKCYVMLCYVMLCYVMNIREGGGPGGDLIHLRRQCLKTIRFDLEDRLFQIKVDFMIIHNFLYCKKNINLTKYLLKLAKKANWRPGTWRPIPQ